MAKKKDYGFHRAGTEWVVAEMEERYPDGLVPGVEVARFASRAEAVHAAIELSPRGEALDLDES